MSTRSRAVGGPSWKQTRMNEAFRMHSEVPLQLRCEGGGEEVPDVAEGDAKRGKPPPLREQPRRRRYVPPSSAELRRSARRRRGGVDLAARRMSEPRPLPLWASSRELRGGKASSLHLRQWVPEVGFAWKGRHTRSASQRDLLSFYSKPPAWVTRGKLLHGSSSH